MSYLYIAQSTAGLIKAGRTSRPDDRTANLRSAFRLRGHELRRIGFTTVCGWGWVAEKRLLTSMHAQGLRCIDGREWFADGDFDSLIQTAQRISEDVNWVRGASDREKEKKRAERSLARDERQRALVAAYLVLRAHFFVEFQQWQQEQTRIT